MRHGCPPARPRKQKIGDDEDEEPTYVQENTHGTISRAEYDAMVKNVEVGKLEKSIMVPPVISDGHERALEEPGESPQNPAPSKQQVAGIGGNAKRRLAKIVGEDDEMEANQHHVGGLTNEKKVKSKKGKKVKLSFDE